MLCSFRIISGSGCDVSPKPPAIKYVRAIFITQIQKAYSLAHEHLKMLPTFQYLSFLETTQLVAQNSHLLHHHQALHLLQSQGEANLLQSQLKDPFWQSAGFAEHPSKEELMFRNATALLTS